jgi:excinuclease ABC subunit C
MSRKTRALLRPAPTSDEQLALMRESVRAGCADRPGIYRMHASDGEVVYVGKSKRVRTRLLSYFRCGPGDKGARTDAGSRARRER